MTDESSATRFVDVYLYEGDEPTIIYRSGLVSYEESLIRGEFVARGWNGSGATNPPTERIDTSHHPAPQAFWVELGGQLLRSHWEWCGLETLETPKGLEGIVTLRHAVRPVSVKVHTLLDGTAVMTRWLEITNDDEQAAPLSAASPWSGILQYVPGDLYGKQSPYDVGYFYDTHWGNEGDFHWVELPQTGYRIDGRYKRDRHRHPYFLLRNRRTGEHWVGTLGWSGGYCFEFDLDDGHERGSSRLWFRAGPDGPAPLRVLAPGETVTTPQMHLGMTIGDVDACTHELHDHLRQTVLFKADEDRPPFVEVGIGPEQGVVIDEIMHDLDIASEIGGELFWLDAEWYAPPNSNWWLTVGDWQVDPERFPEGIGFIRDAVHERGMLFGLWMDAERMGAECQMAIQHPEWFAKRHDGQADLGGLIDLTNLEAAEWLEAQIVRLISEHELDFFRLDYNIGNIGAGAQTVRDGYVESAYWRYYEFVYGMFRRLRERFPRVVFENCASGGARTDVGMIAPFDHTWITDWQIAPRAFSITSGMTMALPPERVDRIGAGMGQWVHRTAELDFHNRLMLFVHCTAGWTHVLGTRPNPVQIERIKHAVRIYKEFVRPFHRTSRIYHHTPVVEGFDPSGWGVLELAARDRTRAMVGLFRLSDPAEPEYLLKMRGIDVGRRYRVTFDNSGDTVEIDGLALCRTGLPIRLEQPLTSELLIVQPAD